MIRNNIIQVNVADCGVPASIDEVSARDSSIMGVVAEVVKNISLQIPGWEAALTTGRYPQVIFTFEPTVKELSEVVQHWAILLKHLHTDWNPHDSKGGSRMQLLGINDALNGAIDALHKLSEVTDL